MKTLKITSVLAIALFAATSAQAQVSVNVNLGVPVWGPPVASSVDYYYLPDIDAYYDLRSTQYVYVNQGRWIRSRSLPVAYRNYDLRNGRTVVINDYHGRSPYVYHYKHKAKYSKKYYAYDNRKEYKKYDKKYNNKGKGHDKHNN